MDVARRRFVARQALASSSRPAEARTTRVSASRPCPRLVASLPDKRPARDDAAAILRPRRRSYVRPDQEGSSGRPARSAPPHWPVLQPRSSARRQTRRRRRRVSAARPPKSGPLQDVLTAARCALVVSWLRILDDNASEGRSWREPAGIPLAVPWAALDTGSRRPPASLAIKLTARQRVVSAGGPEPRGQPRPASCPGTPRARRYRSARSSP